jgi:hypothetical protein
MMNPKAVLLASMVAIGGAGISNCPISINYDKGAFTYRAQSVMPPSHACFLSIFTYSTQSTRYTT